MPPDATYEVPVIYSFWHRAVFASAWLWRNSGIAVMVSRSFDGEYIARTLEKLGFVAVRGSSSRGGAKALLGFIRQLERGVSVVFTIDGPRGPKYVAKPGPALLSRASGVPMAAFYIALTDAWVLNSWDALMIPKPFSKALVRISAKMRVPAEAGDEEMANYHAQLQAALERGTRFVPSIREARLQGTMVCPRPKSFDNRPILGRVPATERLWMASGHGGRGMSLGCASGRLRAEAIIAGGDASVPAALSAARLTR